MRSSLGKAVKGLLRKVAGDEVPKKRKAAKKAPAKKAATKKAAKKSVAKKPTRKSPARKAQKNAPKKAVKPAAKKVKAAPKKTAKKAASPKKAAAKKAVKTPAKKAVKKTVSPKKSPVKKAAVKKAAKKPAKKVDKPVKTAAKKEVIAPPVAVPKAAVKKEKRPQTNWSKRVLETVAVADQRDQAWVPERSKIKAAIENGLPDSYFSVHRVLYIGAAHGYTISQIAHKPIEIYAVEKSPDMMRHFLPLAENLPSVLPILGDAAYPDSYAHLVPDKVDVLFQDIAQKDQVGIFLSNCERFLAPHGVGMLAVKAASVDTTAEPAAVFADTRRRLEEDGATIVQEITLEPYQKHHRLFVVHLNPYYDW